ncbi:MAG: low molecular weight phosphatase family protein [archaeon]
MKILFVCKYNRFRSQIAEQFFRKYSKNKNLEVSSAGLLEGRYPLDKKETDIVKKFGIKINKKPETISVDKLMKTDLVIIVANDVPKSTFNCEGRYIQKIIVWKIPDNFTEDKKRIEEIIKLIELKVKKLVKNLEDEK